MPTQPKPKRSDRLIRTSERSTYRKCRWAWDLSYNHRLRQRRPSPVLRFGTLVHEALAEYYIPGKKRGPHPAKNFIRAYERNIAEMGEFRIKMTDEEDTKWEDAKEMGVEMLQDYVELYEGDQDWEVIASECPFEAPVYHPRTGVLLFYYAGIVDLIMRQRSTGRIFVWDHKTTDSIGRWLKTLGMNEQASAYWTHAVPWMRDQGIINSKVFDDMSGLYFNFLRRARRDTRPQNALGQYLNQDGSVSKKQPADRFHREPTYRSEGDRARQLQRSLDDYQEITMVQNGELPVVKSPGPFTCGMCGWLDVCELHETGADWQTLLAGITEEWDPYDEHEIRYDEQS
jgi:Zierdtviridae exonuclease